MARCKASALADLDQLIAVVTVDTYGNDEPQTVFLDVFNQEVQLPAAATVVGMPVDVLGFDYRDERPHIVPGVAVTMYGKTSLRSICSSRRTMSRRGCRPPTGGGSGSTRIRATWPPGGGHRGCRTRSLGYGVAICRFWSVGLS